MTLQRTDTTVLMRQKITPPGLPAATVRRRRLDELYDSLLHDHDTLVVFAAAGSGKTVQAQLYAERAGLPLAWLSLDRYDKSPSRMITYLAKSLAPFSPEAEKIVDQSLPNLAADEVALLLAESVSDEHQIVLVLDQLESIAESAQSCEALQAFLDFRPGNLRVILMGRSEMQFTVGRWLLQGRAGRVNDDVLALTSDEAQDLMAAMGSDVTDTSARLASSGGWLAGFAFDSVLTPGASVSHDFAAYLSVEILDRLTPGERDFLLDASVLDAVTPAAAEAIHGSASRIVWPTVATKHLPMTISPDQTMVLHPCFRDFLRDRLEIERPDRIPELQRRHAAFLVEHGHAEDAVELLLAEGLLNEAAAAAEPACRAVLGRGDWDAFLRWARSIGRERINERPILSGALVRAMVGARRIQAARSLALELDHEDRLRAVVDADPNVLPHIAWSLLWHPAEALDILRRYDGDGSAAGAKYVIDVMSNAEPVIPPRGLAWSDTDRLVSWGLMMQGRIDDLVEMLPRDDQWPPSSPFTTPHPIMGLLWRGETARARELFDNVPDQTKQRLHPVLWLYLEAWLYLCEDQPREAVVAAEIAVVHCRRTSDGLRPVFQIVQGAGLIALGRTDEALAVLTDALATTRGAGLEAYAEWAETFIAAAHLTQGEDEQAATLLRKVVSGMYRAHRFMLLPMAAVYLAAAERRLDNAGDSEAAMAVATTTANSEGILWPLASALKAMPELQSAVHAPDPRTPVAAADSKTTQSGWETFGPNRVVRVKPFGENPDIVVDGQAMQVRRLKILELAALLTLNPSGVSREALQLRLFPESDRGRSGNYFRQIVHNMRSATALTLQRTPDKSVTWAPELRVESDDVLFEQFVARARESDDKSRVAILSDALDLVTGPYLPKSDLEWVNERRYALEVLHEDVAIELAALALSQRSFDVARRAAEVVITHNPYSEDAYRTLIGAELADGREPAARAAYRRAVDALRGIGLQPSSATTKMLQRVAPQ